MQVLETTTTLWKMLTASAKETTMEIARGAYEILYYGRRNGKIYYTVSKCRRLSEEEQVTFNKVKKKNRPPKRSFSVRVFLFPIQFT